MNKQYPSIKSLFVHALKPRHSDSFARARRELFKDIPKTPAKRQSFRKFWRQWCVQNDAMGRSRRIRREIARHERQLPNHKPIEINQIGA